MRQRKHWGWGYEDEQPSVQDIRSAAAFLAQWLGFGSVNSAMAVAIGDVTLPAPRLRAPEALAGLCSDATRERARHAHGSSYRDVVRAFQGRFDHPPDIVARPKTEDDVVAVLAWAIEAGAAVVPYGGGTSVVGGVEAVVDPERYAGVVTIDLTGLDRVLEVDRVSLSARIQAGVLGPSLEAQLREHGVTLRHYPQSFQFSTLGGWIATRASGHFSTVDTHIDDLVESIRAITPAGPWESRRLPGSGAGVSPDRLLIGSEGTLGIITEAWVRVREPPCHRAGAGVRFADFAAGVQAVRAIAQSGLHPAACRLVDPTEAALTGAGDGSYALLVLGFESARVPVAMWLRAALELCAEHGGSPEPADGRSHSTASSPVAAVDSGPVESWRDAFLRAPYLRDTLVTMGVLSETFETAITWERLPRFHDAVLTATSGAVREVCGTGSVTCRLTHVYSNGPAVYYTVLGPARPGSELDQWATIKAAASEAILANGGTITHHHAVGRDHRTWYDRQRPEPFALGLRAVKAALDPSAALNPGVLIDP